MSELEDALPQIRSAWLGGRSALSLCPPAWSAVLGDGAGREPALAALVGHATEAAFRPHGPAGLSPRPLLPALGAPQPGAIARGRLRRLLRGKTDEGLKRGLIWLLAARGYVAHPADWLPNARDDWAPEIYAPWLSWSAAEATTTPHGVLTAETWDDWPWAERRAALAALRRHDPAAARVVLAAKAAAEPAERRLRLLEIVEDRLEAADAELLQAFATDRSDRVGALVRRLMARLGRGEDTSEPARELAGMVELARTGLIRRRTRLRLKPLKTQAQENRRRELFSLSTLAALAGAMGEAESALTDLAPEGEPLALPAFVAMVADTGAEPRRQALLEAMLQDDGIALPLAAPLAARATPEERRRLVAQAASRETQPSFAGLSALAGEATASVLPAKALVGSPAFRALPDFIRAAASDDAAVRNRAEAIVKAGLAGLGLLAEPAAAEAAIDAAAIAGLSHADPKLDVLHLNVALTPERPL